MFNSRKNIFVEWDFFAAGHGKCEAGSAKNLSYRHFVNFRDELLQTCFIEPQKFKLYIISQKAMINTICRNYDA